MLPELQDSAAQVIDEEIGYGSSSDNVGNGRAAAEVVEEKLAGNRQPFDRGRDVHRYLVLLC